MDIIHRAFLCLPTGAFSIKSRIMKTLPTPRNIILTVIGLASVAAILVLTETCAPVKPNYTYNRQLNCTPATPTAYKNALEYWKGRPNYNCGDYKIRYGADPSEGCYSEPEAMPCGSPSPNVTQHLASNIQNDIDAFLQILTKP